MKKNLISFISLSLSLFCCFSLDDTVIVDCENPPVAEEFIQNDETPAFDEEKNNKSSKKNSKKNSKKEKIIQEEISYIPIDLPGTEKDSVDKIRKQYLNPTYTKRLYEDLEKSMPYRLYVRQQLINRNMPLTLEYLPMVESNYKTSAKSRSGALGLWQFMENSVKPFLTLNDYVDERLDPWKSTDAALSKLQDNYNYFGDWLIAIAAYNCGAGAMRKAMKKAHSNDFWYLKEHSYLSNQTAQYVPKLLAIADLSNNPEYYGIELPKHDKEFEQLYDERTGSFDYITVNKAYSLKQLANELRIDQENFLKLNSAYILGYTHPTKESAIRLPCGMKTSAQEALKALSPIEFPVKYTVVKGDSLWGISRRYGITVNSICELNGISENAILRIGKTLYIPAK